jgi:hypothetical protein
MAMIRERFDAGGVIAGLVFVALGIVFLLDRLDVWDLRFEVLWPAVLVGAGVLIVIGALLRRP